MIVKDVIGECLVKMGMKNFTLNDTLTDAEKELRDSLLAAVNIAYREVVSEYLPLVTSESVTFENGVLSVNALDKQILYPIRVTRGEEVKSFKAYPDKIFVKFSGEAVLEYAYMPAPLRAEDSINDLRLTQSALSDGALGEYYFAEKVFDLARNFDTSFRSKMGLLRYKGRRLRLKERGWQE